MKKRLKMSKTRNAPKRKVFWAFSKPGEGKFSGGGGVVFHRKRGDDLVLKGDDLWENGCFPKGPSGTVGFSPFREGGPPRSRCTPEGVPFCDQKGTEKVPPVPRRWTHGQGFQPWPPFGPHRGRGPKAMKGEASPPRSDRRLRGTPAPKACGKTAGKRFNIVVAEMWKT